jgi:3-oxoacyl-[acyl-carrier protein] reductase
MEMNAIITGATKGIGRAIALNLAKKGYNLALCARNHHDLNDLKTALENFGVKVLVIPTDCAQKEQVLNFAEQTMAFFDKVDVLVNNIGVFYPGSLLDEEDEVFEKQQRINVNVAYYLAKIFGKIMRKQCSGHIFNICSVASREAVENAGSYSVTKAAMLSLNHVLRKELAQYNVKVTAIIPGSTLTASWEGTTIEQDKFVQPEDIAKSLYTILNLSNGVNVDELVLKPLNF